MKIKGEFHCGDSCLFVRELTILAFIRFAVKQNFNYGHQTTTRLYSLDIHTMGLIESTPVSADGNAANRGGLMISQGIIPPQDENKFASLLHETSRKCTYIS